MTQLQEYIKKHGNQLTVGHRKFTFEEITIAGEGKDMLAMAKVKAVRATYNGVLALNARVAGKPGAEVWYITSTRQIACFCVFEGQILKLS